jgi:cyclic pyranopterin phosphate synthase
METKKPTRPGFRLRSAYLKLGRSLARKYPKLRQLASTAEVYAGTMEYGVSQAFPRLIRAAPEKLTVAITAFCNLRCTGCRYGRDFMPGQQLSLDMVKSMLEDAAAGGIKMVRFYGGEPLLHPDLPAMIAYARECGLDCYITTNGILLKQKIDALYAAGLRSITIGYYGNGARYDEYVNRANQFQRLEESVRTVRERYGREVDIQLNYLIMRPSCGVEDLRKAWEFARRYDMSFHTDLIHYSLPYFTEGPDRELQFRPEDEPKIRKLVAEMVLLKQGDPVRFKESLPAIFSIPDWLMRGPDMRVPCDAKKLIWVGADGTVQLCYVTFKLGNLHDMRLRDMLFTPTHEDAARDAFLLNCPNCHCERDSRIQKHLSSRRHYSAAPPSESAAQ